MKNHYETLGLYNSATQEEIRRAYRILARRYHPDVNPGKSSEEKFKAIAEAYHILSDSDRKRVFDIELEQYQREHISTGAQAYQRAQRQYGSARKRFYEAKHQNFGKVAPSSEPPPSRNQSAAESHPAPGLGDVFDKAKQFWQRVTTPPKPEPRRRPAPFRKPAPDGRPPLQTESAEPDIGEFVKRPKPQPKPAAPAPSVVRISVVEVSVSIRDAVLGIRKTVEITEPEGSRKISVNIPPGVRNGSVVHLRSRGGTSEDLVVVIRVASHPFLSMQPKGLVVEVPISVSEAVLGASISVPTLDNEVVIKVPPGSQSGSEIRIKGKGVLARDGVRGDLFIRLLVKVPEAAEAVGIADKAKDLEAYYDKSVRAAFPKTLLEP